MSVHSLNNLRAPRVHASRRLEQRPNSITAETGGRHSARVCAVWLGGEQRRRGSLFSCCPQSLRALGRATRHPIGDDATPARPPVIAAIDNERTAELRQRSTDDDGGGGGSYGNRPAINNSHDLHAAACC